jgi:hypothetical protein
LADDGLGLLMLYREDVSEEGCRVVVARNAGRTLTKGGIRSKAGISVLLPKADLLSRHEKPSFSSSASLNLFLPFEISPPKSWISPSPGKPTCRKLHLNIKGVEWHVKSRRLSEKRGKRVRFK